MKKTIIWVLCLAMSIVAADAQGLKRVTEAESKQMAEQINRKAASIRTMDSRFIQVKTLRFLNDKMTAEGRMVYDGGNKLRWAYEKPYSYTFVLNGEQVLIHSGKNQQRIDISQSKLFQGIAEVMMSTVTGRGLTSGRDFACSMWKSDGGDWVAVLTPKRKEMKKLFKEIRLHIGSREQMVKSVEMTEQSGDTTVITLKDVKTNGAVDAKMFAVE